jgi:hypothetical protein
MDSKIKARSSPGTPLTVKWAQSSTEAIPRAAAPDVITRRVAVLASGFVIGLGVFGVIYWLFDAVMGSLGGYETAIGLGVRFRGLPTLNDLALTRIREGMSPLDLKPDDRVPVTLKTPNEVRTKR